MHGDFRATTVAVCCLPLLMVPRSPSHAQTLDSARRDRLDQFFDRLADRNKAMGTLTVAQDGHVVYTRALGYGEISATERRPLTTASRFRIGSITKTFTAAMVLQLVDEGKLRLTDPLSRFLPQLPNAAKITIAQILAHRSGIPNVPLPRDPSVPTTHEEILARVARATPEFEPGTQHAYSNTGYIVLGFVLEKVTGMSYAAALQERITSRIGLRDTYVATGTIDVGRNEALTYFNSGTEWKLGPQTHPSYLFSAGALVSTTGDLARFIQALFDPKLVSRPSLELMRTIQDGEGSGMEPFTLAGRSFYGHTGGGDNYGAWLAYQPEDKLVIAYATNAKVHPVQEIVRGVADLYYNQPFQIPVFETIVVSPEILDRYVGVYSSTDLPVRFTVTRQGTTLFVQPGAQTATALEATAPNLFQLLGGSVVFEFDAAKNQMIQRRGGMARVFTKER
jgi:CubicO group peptidase (beta-lactamase class C family)